MASVAMQPIYENGALSRVTGGPMRPGGMDLTDRLLALCNLSHNARILDLGCGTGGTVKYLLEKGYRVTGIDHSTSLLETAVTEYPHLPLSCSPGDRLPVASSSMDAVTAECSLSAMPDLNDVLIECRRILCNGGLLAVSDLYARNPEGLSAVRSIPFSCGICSLLTKDILNKLLLSHGFEIIAWEDHSESLKNLTARLIWEHGSLSNLWKNTQQDVDPFDFQVALNKAGPGYFLLVAKKIER